MKMKGKIKIIQLMILFVASIVVVFLASQSYAKYHFSHTDKLTGTYVDFRLTHNGDGQTALLNQIEDEKYEYEGFITLSLVNQKDDKISQRAIQYNLRTPNNEELKNNEVKDIWGESFHFSDNSEYYDVEIVKTTGESYKPEEKIDPNGEYLYNTYFEEKVLKEIKITLKINRLKSSKINNSSAPLEDTENITVVLETSRPYKTTSIFQIHVSNSLVFVDCNVKDYFGFKDLNVNIKTAKRFIYKENVTDVSPYESLLPTKLEINYANSIFDEERFHLSVENLYNELTDENSYEVGYIHDEESNHLTLFIPMGSSITLHFYISKDVSLITKCYLNNKEGNDGLIHDYTSKVAGIHKENDKYYIYAYQEGGQG